MKKSLSHFESRHGKIGHSSGHLLQGDAYNLLSVTITANTIKAPEKAQESKRGKLGEEG